MRGRRLSARNLSQIPIESYPEVEESSFLTFRRRVLEWFSRPRDGEQSQEEEKIEAPRLPRDAHCSIREGRSKGILPCCQELAYEIIVREIHLKIRDDFRLWALKYNGDAFIAVSTNCREVTKALCALKHSIDKFKVRRSQDTNTGIARDLVNVKMNSRIKYLGNAECVFCGEAIKKRERVRRTPCMHIFHMECLQPWLKIKQVCPIDKMPI